MPSVSIVIPAYNPGSYLQFAVQSVINQSFQDWELIVVDDGSPEDISYIETLDPRVVIVRQKNSGQSIARNVGIMASTGEYIAFLDQDDLWNPTKLEKQVEAMQEDAKVVLCHTQFSFIDEAGHNTTEIGFGRYQTYYDLLEGSGICGASTVMVRRTALEKCGLFDFFSQPAEDYDVWLRLMYKGKMFFVPSCEVQYRKHNSNQSIQYKQMYDCIVHIIKKHLLIARQKGDAKAMASAQKGLKRIRGTFGSQAYEQSRESLRQAKYSAFLNHFSFAARHSSRYVLRSMASKVKNDMGLRHKR